MTPPTGTSAAALPALLDVDQVAAALAVSRWSVYRWATAGLIPCVRAGRVVRFELEAVIAALRSKPAETLAPVTRAQSPRPAKRAGRARPEPCATATTAAAQPFPEGHEERVLAVVAVTRALGRK